MNILEIDDFVDSFSIPYKTMMDVIASIEKNFDVNSVRYDGLMVWPVIRLALWAQLGHPSRNFTRRTTDAPLKLPHIHLDERSITYLQRCEKPDLLFSSRPGEQTTQIEDRFYNPYTDPMIELARESHEILKLEFTEQNTKKTLPRFELTTFIEYTTGPSTTISGDRIENFTALQKIIESICGVLVDEDFVKDRVYQIKKWESFFGEVLSLVRPRAVFVVCYYRDLAMGLIRACREMSIPTVDIQHGKQGKYHGAYTHWTKVPSQGYDLLPNFFWSWARESKENIEKWFPGNCQRHHSVIGGNQWLAKWVEDENFGIEENLIPFYESLGQFERVILSSFQPIGDEAFLSEHVIEAMRCSPESWVWLLRLHPLYSSKEHKDRIREIMRQNGITNYEIDNATSCPLYALLKFCDHHITAWSSVCYEALVFGVPTTLVHREGWALYDSYIEQGLFNRADNAEELIAHISREYSPEELKEPVPYIEVDRKYGEKAIETILGRSGGSPVHIGRRSSYGPANAAFDDKATAEEFFKSGFYSMRKGNLKKAIRSFDNAIACCPLMPELHFALATNHSLSGDLHAAQKACEAELKIQPGHNGTLELLGKIEKALNNKPTTEFVIK